MCEGQNEYQIRQCWIARLRKSSFFANESHKRFIDPTSLFKSSCSNGFGCKKKKKRGGGGERKEGNKSCIIVKLLRLTPNNAKHDNVTGIDLNEAYRR